MSFRLNSDAIALAIEFKHTCRAFQKFEKTRPACDSPTANQSTHDKPLHVSRDPRGSQYNRAILEVKIVGPHNGSVRTSDRVLFKPVDLIQEEVKVRRISAPQVVT